MERAPAVAIVRVDQGTLDHHGGRRHAPLAALATLAALGTPAAPAAFAALAAARGAGGGRGGRGGRGGLVAEGGHALSRYRAQHAPAQAISHDLARRGGAHAQQRTRCGQVAVAAERAVDRRPPGQGQG